MAMWCTPEAQRYGCPRRRTGQTLWDAARSPGPPEPSSSHFRHPFYGGSSDAGQPPSSPGSGETRQTNAQSFLHPAIAATQLSISQESPYHLWPLASWNRIINA